jgi:putative transposase
MFMPITWAFITITRAIARQSPEAYMPQSLSRVLVHLVFSTKYRERSLVSGVRQDLHGYMVGILQQCGCTPIQIGGVEDHVHLLFALSRTMTIAQAVNHVKTNSTKWLKGVDRRFKGFRWRGGYGTFSVCEDAIERVKAYIANQEEHHRTMTYQDEFRTLMRRAKIEFDEDRVWD